VTRVPVATFIFKNSKVSLFREMTLEKYLLSTNGLSFSVLQSKLLWRNSEQKNSL
jgi:hypothetical protein